jgi:hypothetical protein
VARGRWTGGREAGAGQGEGQEGWGGWRETEDVTKELQDVSVILGQLVLMY